MAERAELRELLSARPEVRRVFDALKSDRWDVNPVIEVPALSGDAGVRQVLVRKVFATLEEFGHGRLVLGRRTHATRFIRDEKQVKKPFRHVLPSFKFPAVETSPISRLVVTKAGPARRAAVTEWTVKLLKRKHARVLLPADLGPGDVALLRKFLDAYEAQLHA